MFATEADVIRALARYRDAYDPRTTSLMAVGASGSAVHGEPFRAGFIARFEERAELERRLAQLADLDRALLIMWFAQSRPVTEIARTLRISRVHCYRVRRRALERMVRPDQRQAATTAS